jgi:hypothetical protein
MAREYTQEQLEKMVNGDDVKPRAAFFEKAVLNHVESKATGHKVYDKAVYIKTSQPGITDWVAYRAQKADIKEYADEYEHFLNNKQGERDQNVDSIPGLDIIHMQELFDMGLRTVPQLAQAEMVPTHLEYARKAAVHLNNAYEEIRHGQKESQQEESSQQETQALPTQSRQHHIDHVSGPLPAGDNNGPRRETQERVRQGGRDNNRQNVDNWAFTDVGTGQFRFN